jgi:hypothetical protein
VDVREYERRLLLARLVLDGVKHSTTVFSGTTWIFMGLVTGGAATYFIARHTTTSRKVEETRESSLPVTTMDFPTMTSRSHHNAPVRSKVRRSFQRTP